jgi:hypothetical protein
MLLKARCNLITRYSPATDGQTVSLAITQAPPDLFPRMTGTSATPAVLVLYDCAPGSFELNAEYELLLEKVVIEAGPIWGVPSP